MSEGYGVGHLERYSCSEGADLFMNIHQERIRFPATHFANCNCIYFVEVHCHGSASSKGVAADVGWFVSKAVQANVTGGLLDGFANMVCGDLSPGCEQLVVVIVDWCCLGSAIAENMVHSSG